MELSNDLNEFLDFLEFQTACSMEMHNLNFKAEEELIYKEPINLN